MARATIASVAKDIADSREAVIQVVEALARSMDEMAANLTAVIGRADAAIERTSAAASSAADAATRSEIAGQMAHAAATQVVEMRQDIATLSANLTALADRLAATPPPDDGRFLPVGKLELTDAERPIVDGLHIRAVGVVTANDPDHP
jgi:argininosuccinate lyase